MFFNCSSLIYINGISDINTKRVKDMSGLFFKCYSLISLPDISKWETSNVKDISLIFYGCSSLQNLPDISKWNTSKINDMSGVFSFCTSLLRLPEISKWDTNNVTNMSGLFLGCSSLKYLSDISKWNTKNVRNMSFMFAGFSFLTFKFFNIYNDINFFNFIMKETKDFGIDINFYQYSESFLNDVFISNDLSILFNLSENNMKKLNVILGMNLNFSELQKLPNISIWNMNNVEDQNGIHIILKI